MGFILEDVNFCIPKKSQHFFMRYQNIQLKFQGAEKSYFMGVYFTFSLSDVFMYVGNENLPLYFNWFE